MTTQEQTLSTLEVSNRFFFLAEKGNFDQILDELYSENVKSIEAENSTQPSTEGLAHKREKAEKWKETIEEMHSSVVEEPVVAGNYFACSMSMDLTLIGKGRVEMDEIAVYKVENGKIVSEQFFF